MSANTENQVCHKCGTTTGDLTRIPSTNKYECATHRSERHKRMLRGGKMAILNTATGKISRRIDEGGV